MQRADVIVIGAGPAGSAAAITLASAGRDVIVVDKATFPRDKCCGDGLTSLALRLTERLGVEPSTMPSWIHVDDAVVVSPTGVAKRFPMPRDAGTYAAVVRRTEYDAALVDRARAAGAKVLDGHGMRSISELDDRVRVEVDGIGTIEARYAIAADGMWSPTRKALGLGEPKYRGEWHAFRAYVKNVSPVALRDLYVWFEPDLLPGYAWSFPLADGTANVGFGVQRDALGYPGRVASIQAMSDTWRDLLQRPHVVDVLGPDAELESRHTAWPIPARIDEIVRTGRRTFFIGDAVAATDAMTGEGIGQALLTGILAAQAIDDTGPHGARIATAAYEEAVDHHLVADHKMSLLLIRALRHRKGARAAIRVAGATPWTRRNFARWLFEDYPRNIISTPSRWHRGMFTGPGSFRSPRALRHGR